MKTFYVVLVASLLFIGSGCTVEHHRNCGNEGCASDYGDISFDWKFDTGHYLTTNCNDQYVLLTDVYFEIYNSTNYLEDSGTVNCTDGGVTLYNFLPGNYRIYLEGLDTGKIYFQGTFHCYVDAGYINDCGYLTLTAI
jgi:hypothetical protein